MFIVDIFNEMKKKRFLVKSAKTALLFGGKVDRILVKLEDDKRKLLEFSKFKANAVKPNQPNRLRTSRNAQTQEPPKPDAAEIKDKKVSKSQTDNKKLYKVILDLNLFNIMSQTKTVQYFSKKAKFSEYTKYILAGGDLDAKANKILAKCDEVYNIAKSVTTDETLLLLVEKGYIGVEEDLAQYKKILEKYI